MRQRFVLWIGLCVALASPASAEVLRFSGTFDSLVDCPDTSPGTACGNPPPIAVNIPFSFSLVASQPQEEGRIESTAWSAPEFPLPPPVTQPLFESLDDRTFLRLSRTNTIENGPIFHNLLSSIGRTHVWTGIDAQGRSHSYAQSISATFEGAAERAVPGAPITVDEMLALFNEYRVTGRDVDVFSDVSWSITNPDGSFQAAGHRLSGHFRLCRAPGPVSIAVAAVVARVRGG